MSEKVDLPKGGWALLRDPDDVLDKHRKPVVRASMQVAERIGDGKAGDLTVDDTLDFEWAIQDSLTVAMVAEWSYDLPVTVAALGELPAKVTGALHAATAPFLTKILPDFTPSADPDSPGLASPGSGTG